MNSKVNVFIWVVVTTAVIAPMVLAANSELLQWRDPIYIVAGFAGVVAMALLLLQPLLASGYLPGITLIRSRRIHRFVGVVLVLTIITHVVGLWVTSPPDVIDALLFRSATSFSIWGVIAMWGVFLTATLAAVRKKFRIKPRHWRIAHKSLAAIVVACSIAHAVLIDGSMESVSKYALCVLVAVLTIMAIGNIGATKINSRSRSLTES